MKIHEYQGKQILKKFGVTVPRGIHCTTVDDAVKAAETLGGSVWVVKAQIHAGGRGKGGGVKVAKSLEQVREYAGQILGMQLVTHQTGQAGQKVRNLLVEEGADIKHEYYVAALTDRATGPRTRSLLRLLEVPAIVGVEGLFKWASDGDVSLLDADHGLLVINPSRSEVAALREYKKARSLPAPEDIAGEGGDSG